LREAAFKARRMGVIRCIGGIIPQRVEVDIGSRQRRNVFI
jgi:hypothetical protein